GIAGVIFPLVARSFGLVASIVGVFVVRAREDEAPMSALNRGYIVASVLAAILFGVAAWAMLQPSSPTASGSLTWAYYWVCGIAGGGIYGTAIATMGMLSTAAYILAMDTFGPIVDNGAGIIEMAGMSEAARKNMDKLDAAGNTTKALTKGYAVGSAALAAFLL